MTKNSTEPASVTTVDTPMPGIRYALGTSSFGFVLVATTDRGICSIFLGDDPGLLVNELKERFDKREIGQDDGGLRTLVRKVEQLLEWPASPLDLPLDVQGTPFQMRVWQALREIPAGSTATYTEIARRLGSPKSARAVAGACAANPVAVVIPCHRVVRADGTLSGYHWGIERKAELLRREGAPVVTSA